MGECGVVGDSRGEIGGWIAVRDDSSDEMVTVCARCFEQQTGERIP